MKGVILTIQERYYDALLSLDRVLELNAVFVAAIMNKGIGFKEMGKYNEAIALYYAAFELDPTYQPAQNNKEIALSLR